MNSEMFCSQFSSVQSLSCVRLFLPQTRRGMTLLSQLCRDPVVGAETERKPEVPVSPESLMLNVYQISQGIVIMVESNQNIFTPGRHNAYQFGYFY